MPRKPGKIAKKNPLGATTPRIKDESGPATRRRRTIQKDGPHPIDIHVGHRVRERRTLLGLSQSHLAEQVSLTFQQIQKYERGTNRISASRLWQLSEVLGVPISWFFEDVDGEAAPGDAIETKTETLKLARYFFACPPAIRRQVAGLIKAAAEVC